MKILKRAVIAIALIAAAASVFFFGYMRPRYVLPILMYHGVSDVEGTSLYVKPEVFARQMEFLRDNGYKVISLDEFVSGTRAGREFGAKTIVITFDDGFEDNYLNAFPVLVKYRMPATIFLITGYVGREKGYLNWDQVRVMYENGIDFGGHTRNNVYLPSAGGKAALEEEIEGPREDILSGLGAEAEYFCYPTGGFNEEIKNMVKAAGYKGACTTNRGYDRYNRDLYELKRVKITNSDATRPFHFRAKLSGYYNLFRSLKNPE